MSDDRGLDRVADALADDAQFLSGWLPKEPDGRAIVREKVELDDNAWNKLLLCRPPLPSSFWRDVQTIAAYVQADPSNLAQGLREAASLGALRQVSDTASASQRSNLLAAARDAAAETIPLQPSPQARFQELADRFWSDAGQGNGHRDLQRAVSAALPLAVTQLPKLGLHSASAWLHRYGIDYGSGEPDRPLRGLLVATRGLGMVFIDGSLPEPDRLFTLAHEVGHFLIDYLEPRRRALKEMPELAGVIDGEREPTRSERARALLGRVPIGTHTHLLERDPHGGASERVEVAEDDATMLAMELLAPWDDALETVKEATQNLRGFDEQVGAATNALAARFNLAGDVARARAQACLEASGRRRGFFER